MAKLDDLSTELIFDILGRIPPEDIESTTLISKTVYPIAHTLLDQHRKVLVQQYEEWDDLVTVDSHPLYRCRHIYTGLLCTVVTDPRLARMVKKLKFYDSNRWRGRELTMDPATPWRPDEHYPGSLPGLFRSQPMAESGSMTRIQVLKEAVSQCSLVTQSQQEQWLKILRAGSEELAIVLLLWHLPALRSITIYLDSTAAWTEIYAFLLQIVEHAVTMLARRTSALLCAEQPLQDLQRLSLTFGETRFESIALFRAFLSLPRLSFLECEKLAFSSAGKATPIRKFLEPSVMKSLVFQDCTIDMAGLSGLLEGVTAVTSFTYTWRNGKNISDNCGWVKFGPPAIVGALVGSVSHRLEELEISVWDPHEVQYIDTSIGFRGLCLLKSLDITTNIMYAPTSSNLSNFIFMLPERLEQLKLSWIKSAPVPDIRTLVTFLKDLGDQAKFHLTSLRTVRVYGYFDVAESAELPPEDAGTRCRSIGHLTLSVTNREYYR